MKAPARELDPIATGKLKSAIRDFYERLQFLTDWRTGKTLYDLAYIVSCLAIGLVVGDNDVATVEETVANNGPLLESWLGKNICCGCPSDTTMLRALWNIHPTELLIAISEWNMNWMGNPDGYSIDGKAIKAALAKCEGKTHSPYILNAFSSDGSYLAAQIKIAEKKNELAVVCALFHMLPMIGALITTDAFATHVKVLKEARDLGAHCLIPIKDNQEVLNKSVFGFFHDAMENHPKDIKWYEEKDNGKVQHGRKEYRKAGIITKGVKELVEGTRFEGLIAGIAYVNRKRIVLRHGDAQNLESEETIMYLFTDPTMTAERLSKAARNHWAGCEIVHYVLDTEFCEDFSTITKGYGMENMSALRKWAYSLLFWIKAQAMENGKNLGSFHIIRIILRDLEGIPMSTTAEFRKQVNEMWNEKERRRKRHRTHGTVPPCPTCGA